MRSLGRCGGDGTSPAAAGYQLQLYSMARRAAQGGNRCLCGTPLTPLGFGFVAPPILTVICSGIAGSLITAVSTGLEGERGLGGFHPRVEIVGRSSTICVSLIVNRQLGCPGLLGGAGCRL